MKIKKKRIIIGGVAAAVIAVAGVTLWLVFGRDGGSSNTGNTVYVDSVANICGLGTGNGLIDRFSGVVEPQETLEIKLPSDRTVDEILVEEGTEVAAGDKLFTYNTQEMEESLAQAEIDLDRLANEIEQTRAQITALQREKASASSDAQLSYTTQINTAENDIKRNEYEQKTKQVEIEKLKANIANATVTSDIAGVVKSINEDSSTNNYTGEEEAFMTILANGDYRVKGTVNEQNIYSIVEGSPVIVYSRVDDSTWTGTLTAVDMDNPETNNSNMYYYSSDGSSSDTSSNYPFYVDLDSADNLMLGQHVYIELDNGQTEIKEGIWLDSYYIVQEEDKAYVWAANSRDRIEKREITLGEFDEDMQQYQVTDGLTEEDYIAFPDETIQAGDQAEKNVDMMSGGMDGMDMDGIDNAIPEFDEDSYSGDDVQMDIDEGYIEDEQEYEDEEFGGEIGVMEMEDTE